MQPETVTEVVDSRYSEFEIVGAEPIVEDKPQEVIPKEEPKEVEELEDATEAEEGEETAEEKPKRKRGGGYQKTIARLKLELADRDTELNKYKSPDKLAPNDDEPKLENYSDWNEYNKELRAYDRNLAKQEALEEFETKQREESSKKEVAEKAKNYSQQQEIARKTHDDYDDVLADVDDVEVKVSIRNMLLESDVGAEMAYHLASNPDLLDELNARNLSDVQLGKRLGQIEASLQNKTSKPAVNVTKVPPPIKPIRAKAIQNLTPENAQDYESYYKARGF